VTTAYITGDIENPFVRDAEAVARAANGISGGCFS